MRRLTFMLLLLIPGCSGPTSPATEGVQEARARWTAHGLADYAFSYRTEGFFNTLDRHTWRVTVHGGQVVAAFDLATGTPLPAPTGLLEPINDIFAWMTTLDQNGLLVNPVFDPTLGYPRSFRAAGIPDASGSITIGDLVPVP